MMPDPFPFGWRTDDDIEPEPATVHRIDGDHDGDDTDRFGLGRVLGPLTYAAVMCAVVTVAAHSTRSTLTGPAGTAAVTAIVAAGTVGLYAHMRRDE